MPLRNTAGFSTVECLVALTIFSIGGLGAAGTIALSIRLSARGTHAAQAARLAAESIEDLHVRLGAAGALCAAIAAGSRSGQSGVQANWLLTPVGQGMSVSMAASYATPSGQHTDSIRAYLRCR